MNRPEINWLLVALAVWAVVFGGLLTVSGSVQLPDDFYVQRADHPQRPAPPLSRTGLVGQSVSRTPAPLNYLWVYPGTYLKQFTGDLKLIFLAGDRPPQTEAEIKARTIGRRVVPGDRVQDNQPLRVDVSGLGLGGRSEFYLIVGRGPEGADQKNPPGPITLWLSRDNDWPPADILTLADGKIAARPAWGNLALRLGYDRALTYGHLIFTPGWWRWVLAAAAAWTLIACLAAAGLFSPGFEFDRRLAWATGGFLLVAAGALPWVNLQRVLPYFLVDDSLISLRYADRLLHGQGLTWTDGPRVEGYSNLLWILLVSAGTALIGNPILTARLLGFGGLVALMAAVVYRYRPLGPTGVLAPAAALFLAATLLPLAVWTVGGMEVPLAAALLAWNLVLLLRVLDQADPGPADVVWPGLVVGLLCLTRPDGPLFAAAGVLGLVIGRGVNAQLLRLAGVYLAPPVAMYLGQLAFRLAYYGQWVPNTALVKLGFSPERFGAGLAYLERALGQVWPALILAGAALLGLARRRSSLARAALLLIPAGMWLAYVAAIGGDWMVGFRHLAPVMVILVLLTGEGLAELGRRGRWAALVILIAFAGLTPYYLQLQWGNAHNLGRINRAYTFTGQPAGLFLKTAFAARQPLVAVSSAGAVPFWSGLNSLDMLGLNDFYIPRHKPETFGRGGVGHELGNGKYVLSRRPDLVLFSTPPGNENPIYLSGRQMVADPDFKEHYRPFRFEAEVPVRRRGFGWLRQDGRLGPRRSETELIWPGYLLGDNPHTIWRLDDRGLYAEVTEQCPVKGVITLEPGQWRLTMVADGGPGKMIVTAARPVRVEPDAVGALVVAPTGARVKLKITAEPERPIQFRRVIIRSAGPPTACASDLKREVRI